MKKVVLEISGLSFVDEKELLATTDKVYSYNFEHKITNETINKLKRILKNGDNFVYLKISK
jgi:hypothetical protein